MVLRNILLSWQKMLLTFFSWYKISWLLSWTIIPMTCHATCYMWNTNFDNLPLHYSRGSLPRIKKSGNVEITGNTEGATFVSVVSSLSLPLSSCASSLFEDENCGGYSLLQFLCFLCHCGHLPFSSWLLWFYFLALMHTWSLPYTLVCELIWTQVCALIWTLRRDWKGIVC